MPFISTSTAAFAKPRHQKAYNDTKAAISSAHQSIDGYLLSIIPDKLKKSDKHFALMDCMLRMTKHSLNMAQQACEPMLLELFEYAIKNKKKNSLGTSVRKNLCMQEVPRQFEILFKALTSQLYVALSILDGRQSINDLWQYFSHETDEQVRQQLSRQITDETLLAGFMACRAKYGFFLQQAFESEKEFKALSEKIGPAENEAFVNRWNNLKTLLSENLVLLKQSEFTKQQLNNITDQGSRNLLTSFGIFGAIAQSHKSKKEQFEAKLNEILNAGQEPEDEQKEAFSLAI